MSNVAAGGPVGALAERNADYDATHRTLTDALADVGGDAPFEATFGAIVITASG